MAKLTDDEKAKLKELQDKEAAAEDDDDAVWVRSGDHEIRLTGKRRDDYLRRHDITEAEADASTPDNPIDPGEPAAATPAATTADTPKPAKKTAAAAKPADGDQGDGDQLDADAPATTTRPRPFF